MHDTCPTVHMVLGPPRCTRHGAYVTTAASLLQAHSSADVHLGPPLDTSSPQSVRAFADAWHASGRRVDVLILNAGVARAPRTFTAEGVAELAQVNYLAAYCLSRLLEDVLVACRARVVTVSSVMHRAWLLHQLASHQVSVLNSRECPSLERKTRHTPLAAPNTGA